MFQALIKTKSKGQMLQIVRQIHPFDALIEAVLKGQ